MSPPLPDPLSNDQLLAAAGRGDRGALWQLIENYRPYLLKVASRSLADDLSNDRSSVVQVGFVRGFSGFDKFVGQTTGRFRAWLGAIVRNEALTRLKRVGRLQRLPVDSSGEVALLGDTPSPSEQAARREQAGRLRQAMDQLPEYNRRVLDLRIFEGHSYAAIAKSLGVSPDAVRQRWTRAVKQLREILGDGHEPRSESRSC